MLITPLRKHRGQDGALIAFFLLVATVVVVVTTRPAAKPAESTPPHPTVAPAASIVQPLAAREEQPRTIAVDPNAPVIGTGTTDYDEALTSHIRVPVHGWLKKTRASSVGRKVRAGETVGVIYSPEVFLTSASVIRQLRDFQGQEALDAERWRLLRWGMRQTQLSEIERTQRPQAALPLIARVTGVVVREAGAPAQLVEPGTGLELFTITDPAHVSVYVDVPVAAAARLAIGARAAIAIRGIAHPVTAQVAYIYRAVDDGKRKVRFDVYSPRIRIEPNLPVTATFAPAR